MQLSLTLATLHTFALHNEGMQRGVYVIPGCELQRQLFLLVTRTVDKHELYPVATRKAKTGFYGKETYLQWKEKLSWLTIMAAC